MPKTKEILKEMFARLYGGYGAQYWWPGESAFEIMVGAILTQNTHWSNVEKAITSLKASNKLSLQALIDLSTEELALLIKPAGYFNVKAKRLKNFLQFLHQEYDGRIEEMTHHPTERLREQLLGVSGIGPETADSILLYALGHPVFVIDAYTHRVFTRHHLIEEEADYQELQALATDNTENSTEHYNEFHALLVRIGKEHCKPKPKCEGCPLEGLNW